MPLAHLHHAVVATIQPAENYLELVPVAGLFFHLFPKKKSELTKEAGLQKTNLYVDISSSCKKLFCSFSIFNNNALVKRCALKPDKSIVANLDILSADAV